MTRLEQDAQHLCARFGLRYRVLEAERANVKRRYGVCFSDGTIRIRLRHAATGRPLKYSSLVNTLCHELAHLRHFNHGPHFQAFYARILHCARREGIYRPKAAAEARWPAVSQAREPRAPRDPSEADRSGRGVPVRPSLRGLVAGNVQIASGHPPARGQAKAAALETGGSMSIQLELFGRQTG